MDTAADHEALAADPTTAATNTVHRLVGFCNSDPVRYQLLFQRTISGFVRSPESWAVALDAYERNRTILAVFGVHDQATLDLSTAVMAGLGNQQISNDSGGDRWERLIDRAVEMLWTDARIHRPGEQIVMTTMDTTEHVLVEDNPAVFRSEWLDGFSIRLLDSVLSRETGGHLSGPCGSCASPELVPAFALEGAVDFPYSAVRRHSRQSSAGTHRRPIAGHEGRCDDRGVVIARTSPISTTSRWKRAPSTSASMRAAGAVR
jgi:hypothetical protein